MSDLGDDVIEALLLRFHTIQAEPDPARKLASNDGSYKLERPSQRNLLWPPGRLQVTNGGTTTVACDQLRFKLLYHHPNQSLWQNVAKRLRNE